MDRHEARPPPDGLPRPPLVPPPGAAAARAPAPSCVRPYLYLGGAAQAADAAGLDRAGITHVLNATAELPDAFVGQLTYCRVAVQDRTAQPLERAFGEAHAFIEAARAAAGRVLLHCQYGVSRSATLAVAHLMQAEGLTLAAALAAVATARPQVDPNPGFVRQLRALEGRLAGRRQGR